MAEFSAFVHDAQVITYQGPDERYQDMEVMFSFNGSDEGWILDPRGAPGSRVIANLTYPDSSFRHQGWVTDDHRLWISRCLELLSVF
ncbi:MAG: hypothetical protein KDB27_03250 [Planctomycetales bacterium]|nr:hypothetical protein [Planctomycetales bacterium]